MAQYSIGADRQAQIGQHCPIAPALQVWVIGKQRQRLARYAADFALHVLAYHDQAFRFIPAMGLVAQLRDLQARSDLLPLALIYDGLLQRLRQARTDDVADLVPFEPRPRWPLS